MILALGGRVTSHQVLFSYILELKVYLTEKGSKLPTQELVCHNQATQSGNTTSACCFQHASYTNGEAFCLHKQAIQVIEHTIRV